MASFQPPIVERAYLEATHGLLTHGLWDHLPTLEDQEAEAKLDNNLREVIGFSLRGLTKQISTRPQLRVRYERVWQFAGKEGTTVTVPCNDMVPDVIAAHPITKEHGMLFAAWAGHVSGLMLAQNDVVEAVLADNTREKPTLPDTLARTIGVDEVPVEVADA